MRPPNNTKIFNVAIRRKSLSTPDLDNDDDDNICSHGRPVPGSKIRHEVSADFVQTSFQTIRLTLQAYDPRILTQAELANHETKGGQTYRSFSSDGYCENRYKKQNRYGEASLR